MSHNTRAGFIAAAASVLAALAFIEAGPLLQYLSGPNLPHWLEIGRAFILPAVAYLSGWAGHYLLTRDPTPPVPVGAQETPPAGRG